MPSDNNPTSKPTQLKPIFTNSNKKDPKKDEELQPTGPLLQNRF